jgi:hypothetical protein
MDTNAEEESFWQPAEFLTEAPDFPEGTVSVLERLGPSPFPKSGFPFLGFLATVYDHIAAHCQSQALTDGEDSQASIT